MCATYCERQSMSQRRGCVAPPSKCETRNLTFHSRPPRMCNYFIPVLLAGVLSSTKCGRHWHSTARSGWANLVAWQLRANCEAKPTKFHAKRSGLGKRSGAREFSTCTSCMCCGIHIQTISPTGRRVGANSKILDTCLGLLSSAVSWASLCMSSCWCGSQVRAQLRYELICLLASWWRIGW